MGLIPSFTGFIREGCECSTINVQFILFEEPETITRTAYVLPLVGSEGRHVVAREMH